MIDLNPVRHSRSIDLDPKRRNARPADRGHHLFGALNVADLLTLAYLVFSTALIAVCRQNIEHWQALLPIHGGLILLVAGLALARARGIRILSFVSHWYPPLLFLFFFEGFSAPSLSLLSFSVGSSEKNVKGKKIHNLRQICRHPCPQIHQGTSVFLPELECEVWSSASH